MKSNIKKNKSKLFQTTSRDVSFLKSNPEHLTKTTSGFEFLTIAKETSFKDLNLSSMPTTIDEVRVLNTKNSFPSLSIGLLETLEAMQTPVFDRDAQRAVHRKTAEFNVDNCKFSLLLKAKNSRVRNEVRRLSEWVREWSSVLGSRDINSKTLGELRDVIQYCGQEFRASLAESCSTRAELFTVICAQLVELSGKIQDRAQSFLAGVDSLNRQHFLELEKRHAAKTNATNCEMENLRKQLEQRGQRITELTQIIRQLNIKLGTGSYAQKQLREEIRRLEENNQILEKENETITDVIHKIIKELNCRPVSRSRGPLRRRRGVHAQHEDQVQPRGDALPAVQSLQGAASRKAEEAVRQNLQLQLRAAELRAGSPGTRGPQRPAVPSAHTGLTSWAPCRSASTSCRPCATPARRPKPQRPCRTPPPRRLLCCGRARRSRQTGRTSWGPSRTSRPLRAS